MSTLDPDGGREAKPLPFVGIIVGGILGMVVEESVGDSVGPGVDGWGLVVGVTAGAVIGGAL
jgi:hypothetical protein